MCKNNSNVYLSIIAYRMSILYVYSAQYTIIANPSMTATKSGK